MKLTDSPDSDYEWSFSTLSSNVKTFSNWEISVWLAPGKTLQEGVQMANFFIKQINFMLSQAD
jgi:hypothetical protein